jgi:hypothetical protein
VSCQGGCLLTLIFATVGMMKILSFALVRRRRAPRCLTRLEGHACCGGSRSPRG